MIICLIIGILISIIIYQEDKIKNYAYEIYKLSNKVQYADTLENKEKIAILQKGDEIARKEHIFKR